MNFLRRILILSESRQLLKCLLKNVFLKYHWIKSCKSIFYVSVVISHCRYIFKGFTHNFFGFLFNTYFKNSYFRKSISNYLLVDFLEFFWYWFCKLNLYYFIFQRLGWKTFRTYYHSRNIWNKLWFSCKIAHYGKYSIFIFQEIFAA